MEQALLYGGRVSWLTTWKDHKSMLESIQFGKLKDIEVSDVDILLGWTTVSMADSTCQ